MNENGERFVMADMIYVMPDCEGCHARLDRASDVVIPSVAKNLQLLLAFPEKSCIFAVDSSWGIRVEGMTTLSRQLDPSLIEKPLPDGFCFLLTTNIILDILARRLL